MAGMTVAPLCPALRGQSGGIGAFIPQCEDDGSFSSVQCWGSTGYCWCVESTSGRPVTEGVRGEPECPGKLTHEALSPHPFSKFQYKMRLLACNVERAGNGSWGVLSQSALYYHARICYIYLVIIGCSVNGITYQYGERFTAEDGCNTW